MMSQKHNKKGFSGLLSFASDLGEAVGGQNKHEHPQRPRKSITKPGPALLHMAVWRGRAEEIKELLSAGAQLDARDEKGRTPLHEAAFWGRVEAIKALLSAGAQLDARDKYGNTPLHEAAWGGKVEAIKALLSAGAQLHARNEAGETPLDVAVRRGHGEEIKKLLSTGDGSASARIPASASSDKLLISRGVSLVFRLLARLFVPGVLLLLIGYCSQQDSDKTSTASSYTHTQLSPSAQYSPSQTPEAQGADLELKFSEPPVGDDNVLSIAQIRWCLREDIRIEALRPMATTNPQIDQFNLVVDNYNRRCGSYRYYEGTLTRAQQELETMRPQIVAEASLY